MRILLATDGSRYARAAARFLARFVSGEGRHVDVLTIVPEAPRSSHRSLGRKVAARRQWRAEASGRVGATAKTLRDRGFVVRTLIDSGPADRLAVEQARREVYDLVVAGAKGRGATPFFDVGSVAHAMLEQVPAAVLLVRERQPRGREQRVTRAIRPLRVLLATDGTAHSNAAIDRFMGLIHDPNTEITVVSVLQPAEEMPAMVPAVEPAAGDMEHAARVRVNDAINRLAPSNAAITSRILEGKPADAITAEALERDVDLIVLGSGGLDREPLSSVAVQIVRSAPCSVLVVREG